MDLKTYVIGDIHGCINTFEAMLDRIALSSEDSLYLLGDYIDRGPESRKVIDKIIQIRSFCKVHPILGNHEYLMMSAIKSQKDFNLWLKNGAMPTLISFNAFSMFEIGDHYLNFLKDLEYFYLLENFVLVHGGLNFDAEDPFEDTDSMIWTRSKSVDCQKTNGRRLIVGHSPKNIEEIKSSLEKDVITLDGGCVYKHNPRYGYLAALEIGKMELFFEKCRDNVQNL